jgi:hypothetical protein
MNKSFLAVLAVALIGLSSTVSAQEMECLDRDLFIEKSAENGFSLKGRGLQNDGSVLELYTNDAAEFIQIILIPNTPPRQPPFVACIAAIGKYWFDYKPDASADRPSETDKKGQGT